MTNETQIRTLIENWVLAVKNQDINGILAYHSADMVMYDVPPPFQSVGIEAYRKTWDTFFRFTRTGVFDIQELNIKAGEDVAFCYAVMKCSDKSDSGEFVDLLFRLTIGFQKIDERWVIVHEHHSVPAN